MERGKRITTLPLSRTVRPTSSPNGSFGDLSLIRVGVLVGLYMSQADADPGEPLLKVSSAHS